MKKILLLAAVLFGTSYAHADRQGQFPDFIGVATMSVMGVSPSSWSVIPTTGTRMLNLERPIAVFIDHAPQSTQNMLIAFTTSNIAPATTWYGFTYKPSDSPWVLSMDASIRMWAISDQLTQQLVVTPLR